MQPILIIKLGAIGDVLRTTGIIFGLKEKYPKIEIYWLTEKNAIPLLKTNKSISKIFTPADWNTYRPGTYSLVINLDDDEVACRIASEAKTERIIGAHLSLDGKRTYTKDSALWFDMGLLGGPDRDELKKNNERTYQDILSEILGIEGTDMLPLLKLGEQENIFQKGFIEANNIHENEKLIGINTGAGTRWRYKRLDEEKTAKLIDAISSHGRCVLLGGLEERERNARILSMTNSPVIDAGTDLTLLEFASVIGLCSVIITSDSLAMHIAIALQIPTVAFFGPTSSAEIDLFGNGRKVSPPMSCLSCYKRACDFDPICMQLITIDQLASATMELLA